MAEVKTTRLNIRVTEQERDLIKKAAEEENRTASSYVMNLVKQDLEKKIKKKSKKVLDLYSQR